MKPFTFSLIVCVALLGALGQLLLKAGVRSLGPYRLGAGPGLWAWLARVGMQPGIVAGLGCYVLSTLIWIPALSRVDVMVAYPMVSIGYAFNAFLAWEFMGESLTRRRVAGIAIILGGVFILTCP